MLLRELFEDPGAKKADPGGMNDRLRQSAMDLLVPMAGQKVPFVTVQQIVDQLRDTKSGLAIDRSLIMDILNPDTTKIVKSIEGDRIYLQPPGADAEERAISQQDAEREAEQIENKAQKQAKKELAR